MIITNDHNLPEAIYNAVLNDEYSRGKADISVTQLIAPPQQVALTRLHDDEITEDCSQRLWSLMGQAMHTVLERAHDSALQEDRLFAEVDGWIISGQYDRCHVEDKLLQDYKFASVWEAIHGVKDERIAQLNVLRWLALENGHDIERLEIVYLFRDWSPSKAKFEHNYPNRQIMQIPVPVWDLDQVEKYVRERVWMHQQATEHGKAIECTDEDRWATPAKWAVQKRGAKRATRLHDSLESAQEHLATLGNGYEITHRPGTNRRCEDYCAAAPFCPQYQALQEAS